MVCDIGVIINFPSLLSSDFMPAVAGHRKGQSENINGIDFHSWPALSA